MTQGTINLESQNIPNNIVNQTTFLQMRSKALPLAILNLLRMTSPFIFPILHALQPLLRNEPLLLGRALRLPKE